MDRNEKTIELIRQYQSGEADTRNEIIQLNMPLAHFYTKKFKPYDMEYEDALSMTMAAFSQTIEKFDLSREVKFSTYASMQVLTVFSHIYKKQKAKKRQGVVVSLDAPICESEGSTLTLLDTLGAPDQDHLLKDEALRLTKRVLGQFKNQYKKIILASLNDAGTQLEIGKRFGISQIQVSRVLAKFYAAVKQEAERQGYREKEEETMATPIMTIAQYKKFLDRNLTLTEMADELDVQTKSLYNWRLRHKQEIKGLPEPRRTDRPSGTLSELKKLQQEIVNKNIIIQGIEKDIQTYKNSYNANQDELEAAYKKLESAYSTLKDTEKEVHNLDTKVADLEGDILQLQNDKKDLESQLMYTGQDRDKFFNLYQQSNRQLQALEAYVLTVLEPAK
jgi:RNA polymerase sigma factor (sigma-70 family)